MRGTVLVVDDRRAARSALAAELADAGFRVVEADGSESAYRSFQREAPDLVLADLVMPGGDGIELVGRIRASSSVPVVVFTSQGGVPEAVAAIQSGADDFIVSGDVALDEWPALVANRIARAAQRADAPRPRRAAARPQCRDRARARAGRRVGPARRPRPDLGRARHRARHRRTHDPRADAPRPPVRARRSVLVSGLARPPVGRDRLRRRRRRDVGRERECMA